MTCRNDDPPKEDFDDREDGDLEKCTGEEVNGKLVLCDWQFKSDWEGDPSIPNGTRTWHYWECQTCGAQLENGAKPSWVPDPPDEGDAYDPHAKGDWE